MKNKIFFVFLLCYGLTFSQDESLFFLKGKVIAAGKEVSNVFVTNKRSESTVTSDDNGNFSMFVKIGDKVDFEGIQIENKTIEISDYDLKKKLIVVDVILKVYDLKEVKINEYGEINAVSLGILQKPAKKYTPAERRLKTATGLNPTMGIGMVGGVSLSLDPLMNWISGRTAMLKKELEIERKERLQKRIENVFGEEYIVQKLKIPADYVTGFLYYVADNQKLSEASKEKNKTLMELLLSELAVEYIKIITDEQ